MIGTAAADGKLVSETAAIFGSQSVVVSVDVRKTPFRTARSVDQKRNAKHGHRAARLCGAMESHGAGELFVQSIDLEGSRTGYDLTLMKEVSHAVKIPVIACGGAGSLEDIRHLMHSSGVAAAAAGTMFVLHGKHKAPPDQLSSAARNRSSARPLQISSVMTKPYQICARCVMDTTDPDIEFDENGYCNHCTAYMGRQAVYNLPPAERARQLGCGSGRNEAARTWQGI